MSHSGRMLFCGTTKGTLWSMKFPLNVPGEWTEHQGHGAAITKVCSKSKVAICFPFCVIFIHYKFLFLNQCEENSLFLFQVFEMFCRNFTIISNLFSCLPLQMKISYDDQYLITVAEDASIILWKIQDKDGRGLKRDKDFGWAEEILITKSDLEEKVTERVLLWKRTSFLMFRKNNLLLNKIYFLFNFILIVICIEYHDG